MRTFTDNELEQLAANAMLDKFKYPESYKVTEPQLVIDLIATIQLLRGQDQ